MPLQTNWSLLGQVYIMCVVIQNLHLPISSSHVPFAIFPNFGLCPYDSRHKWHTDTLNVKKMPVTYVQINAFF